MIKFQNMTNKNKRILFGGLFILLLFLFISLYFLLKSPNNKSLNTKWDLSQVDLSTYKNTDYGFEISYPNYLIPEFKFKTFYHLSDKWNAEIFTDNSKGIPIISIPVYRIDSGNGAYKSYPLYYDAEIRIGASKDLEDIKNCLNPPSYLNVTSTNENINGEIFKKFQVEDAGMMQYLKGFSYRIVHNNICFAVERLETGSSYREEPNPSDIPDSVLNGYFDKTQDILKTFKFTN